MGKLENIEDSDSLDRLEKGTELLPTNSTLGTPGPEPNPPVIGNGAIPTRRDGLRKDDVDGAEIVLVSWDGPDDPENPKKWASKKKIFNVTIISMMTFLCPLCSAIFVRSRLGVSNRIRHPVFLKSKRILIPLKCFPPSQSRCFYSALAADRSSSHRSVKRSAENQSILSVLQYSP
jgi:hypothetical protein